LLLPFDQNPVNFDIFVREEERRCGFYTLDIDIQYRYNV
jgi:hypothetical protein